MLTAQLTLENANIIEKTINLSYLIIFEYVHINKVMRIIKEKQLKVIHQQLETDCRITIAVRKKNANAIFEIFDTLFEVEIKKL